MQFLLTNEVQIPYATTEGYAPVTLKAQNSKEYKNYLADESVYEVKIEATKLLIDNTENTFVTPVFNGSATLRNEAGQLIETVAKSARRNETIDEAYFEEIYETARLNVDKTSTVSKAELGEMPFVSSLLIWMLIVIWLLLILYVITNAIRQRKNSRTS
jgi:multiple sugar transport system substrate-binding protein